ncbi:MAG: acetate--CoA ligase [Bacillota bacterium]|nr:acetate--CoA ligase [Bacillota bacterium]
MFVVSMAEAEDRGRGTAVAGGSGPGEEPVPSGEEPAAGGVRRLLENRLVPPGRSLRAKAAFSSVAAFETWWERSRVDPDAYWAEVASELEWFSPWQVRREGELPDFRYFVGGLGNVSTNCIDRHVRAGRGNQAAILWEGEDGATRVLTYRMLLDEVGRLANALRALGVGRGDVVAIYMSNIPEVFVAVHACYRIGALYSVIFAGFSAEAVRQRLLDAQPKVVVVADGSRRRGQVLPLKATLERAAAGISSIEHVVVVRHTGVELPMTPGRDLWYHELVAAASPDCPPEPMEANEPGFIIYTSGTESKPKGVVHAGMGFLVGTYANVKWALGLTPEDVYWCTADVGWLTFPIFALVGGMAHGVTQVVYEGALDWPTPDRLYRIVERWGVNKLFTAPTALRMLRRLGEAGLEGHDLSRLELIALVGEPLDPETWNWVRDHLGKGRPAGDELFINNTYGQTETATAWTCSMVGLTPAKPGSAGQPLPGYVARVVDEHGAPLPPGKQGYLIITHPFPSLARTVWGDHGRYLETYFRRFPGAYFTADAAVQDDDGHIWVVGRVDDVINVAGHRLSTMEMEAALLDHPRVAEAAVVGATDPVKGLVPIAFVVPRRAAGDGEGVEEAALAAELSRRIVDAIGPIARPERIYVVPTLPKTRSGKIMRRLLREAVDQGSVHGDTSALENPEALEVVLATVRPAAGAEPSTKS